jgi:hypothetical protein
MPKQKQHKTFDFWSENKNQEDALNLHYQETLTSLYLHVHFGMCAKTNKQVAKKKTIVGREGMVYGYGTCCDQTQVGIERNGEILAN